MNPDSGRIHNVMRDLYADDPIAKQFDRLAGRVNHRTDETAEQLLARAMKRHEELADGEPAPGNTLPDNWHRFAVGDELRPVKGIKFVVSAIDVEAQTITVKPVRR